MIGIIKVFFVVLFNFIYLTIFEKRKIEMLSENEQIYESRKLLKKMSEKIIKSIQIKINIKYIDEKKYRALKKEDKIVVMANHESNFDIPVLVASMDIPVGFVAKQEMEKWPFYSYWMKKSGCIFLNRNNNRDGIKSIKEAIEKINKGYPTVIFPEGNRSEDGEIKCFKKGSFKIPIETKGVILPVTIDGTFEIQNKGSIKIKRGQEVFITIGEPIKVSELNEEILKKINIYVQNKIKSQKKGR